MELFDLLTLVAGVNLPSGKWIGAEIKHIQRAGSNMPVFVVYFNNNTNVYIGKAISNYTNSSGKDYYGFIFNKPQEHIREIFE